MILVFLIRTLPRFVSLDVELVLTAGVLVALSTLVSLRARSLARTGPTNRARFFKWFARIAAVPAGLIVLAFGVPIGAVFLTLTFVVAVVIGSLILLLQALAKLESSIAALAPVFGLGVLLQLIAAIT